MTVCAGMFRSNPCRLTLSSRKTVALHYFQPFFLKKSYKIKTTSNPVMPLQKQQLIILILLNAFNFV